MQEADSRITGNAKLVEGVLPGCPPPQTDVQLRIYCDECGVGDWLYIAMLLVPQMDETLLLQNLLNARCGNPDRNVNWAQCRPLCKYHERNDTEVHWAQLRATQKDKAGLAARWLDFFLNDVRLVRAYVLGMDLAKLDQRYFGTDRVDENIYNRFFRTAILKAAKSFFASYRNICITEIIHDRCDPKETHPFFDWHPIFRINEKDEKVRIIKDTITFLDSDHRKSGQQESHFLQYIDLIVNVFRQGLDAEAQDALKIALAHKALPLLRRLLNEPSKVNSRYRYVGRLKIEFFPKHDLRVIQGNSFEYEMKRFDCFYTQREIKLADKGQGLLFRD